MGMSSAPGGRDASMPHLVNGDCFLGILKLPQTSPAEGSTDGDPTPWLAHSDENSRPQAEPELIYARRFGTPQNAEACSSVLMLPEVNDALLQTPAQLKLALLGHVNPAPMSSAEVNAMGPSVTGNGGGGRRRERRLEQKGVETRNGNSIGTGPNSDEGGDSLKSNLQYRKLRQSESERRLDDGNRGGILHSIADSAPITEGGRAYGFVLDYDLSLTADETFSSENADATFRNAYGALLGGHVLDSSPLVYPVAATQNRRDPNQLYVVSIHSEEEEVVVNPEYGTTTREELDGGLHKRPDLTLGGAGGSMGRIASSTEGATTGGVPKYGTDFYVKVQQLSITPYEQLIDVEPTPDEKIKRTMTSGWGFGFKLNDADDVRPSSIVFVKGRTPNEDLLLLGGTTRRNDDNDDPERSGELDGFITKLNPPAPSPVADQTTGSSIEDAMEDEALHPTKRIDSTTGRDETVTSICLPPPDDPLDGVITHAFVVGSTMSGSEFSMAYILKMRLDDLSTVWKEHVPSVRPSGGPGGDVMGQGCAVSPDGTTVYLGGTINGESAVNTGVSGMDTQPVGGPSDVFVLAFDVGFGNVQWARQFGTVREDTLARGGGVACDNEGNVIVMGSTRGSLQRPRPDRGGRRDLQGQAQQLPQMSEGRLASNIFVMNLYRANGEYLNAPFTDGGVTNDASVGADSSAAAISKSGGSRLSPGGKAGISLVVLGVLSALSFLAMRIYRRKRNRYAANERMWEREGGDDFGFGKRSSFRGRRYKDAPGSSTLRIVRGGSGGSEESVSRNATWMDGAGGDDDGSVYSTGSSSSRGKENSDFLVSLRKEAAATMKKMVKDPSHGAANLDGNDPRLDGGASIKSLLTHYREVKKGGLLEGDNDESSNKKAGEILDSNPRGRVKKPPPPPPPRRKKKDQASGKTSTEPDGLSEFTIV